MIETRLIDSVFQFALQLKGWIYLDYGNGGSFMFVFSLKREGRGDKQGNK